MKPKPKPTSPAKHTDGPTKRTIFAGRDGLGAYITDPASFPASRVVYYTNEFVVINDLFPKASVHLLILPRDMEKSVMRPQNAFDDPVFLAECQAEERKVRQLVASELSRKFGRQSQTDKARLDAMDSDDPPETLPPGRDWSKDVISGIHANPSMYHLHIHVLSKDMVSECMKKTNHYLSFTTDFLVGLDQFPLSRDDHRRAYRHFPDDMVCWRCGKNFENRISKLKVHLDKELSEWVRE